MLGDVAHVVTDHQPLIGDALSGKDAELLLVIEKFPETNTRDVTRGIDDALHALQPGLSGVTIDTTVYRQAAFIEEEVGTLGVALLVSLVLTATMFGAFFRSWRTAVISLITIPVSLTAAALVLYLRGTGMNTMVLAGMVLALAVIVGDVAEDLYGAVRTGRARVASDVGSGAASGASGVGTALLSDTLVTAALRAVRTPILYSLLIMALSVLPVFFVPGEDGALFGPLLLSYLLTLAVAMIVALTVTAALVFVLPVGRTTAREGRTLSRVHSGYGRALSGTAGKGRWVLAGAAAFALAGLALAPQLASGRPTVPVLPDKTLVVQWSAIAGTSDQEMTRITDAAAQELRTLPGVVNVGGHIGRAITSDQVGDISAGSFG
ncbi:putative cation efflux system protein SilA [Arthrobacter sp. Hiyo8]|nr:putative cation efflux system protein SilA [Arthrobacter sp. Hiyo8]